MVLMKTPDVINHALLFLICVLAVETFIRLNFIQSFHNVLKEIKRAQKVILSDKISDHWKEKVVPSYALSLLANSLMILATLLFVLLVFFLAVLLSPSLLNVSISPLGIIESIVFSYVYFRLRKSIV